MPNGLDMLAKWETWAKDRLTNGPNGWDDNAGNHIEIVNPVTWERYWMKTIRDQQGNDYHISVIKDEKNNIEEVHATLETAVKRHVLFAFDNGDFTYIAKIRKKGSGSQRHGEDVSDPELAAILKNVLPKMLEIYWIYLKNN